MLRCNFTRFGHQKISSTAVFVDGDCSSSSNSISNSGSPEPNSEDSISARFFKSTTVSSLRCLTTKSAAPSS
ncbi:hypothetical protein SDJN02_05239, partial [Cucurbita argyrosperma subsp. argyrosperma]